MRGAGCELTSELKLHGKRADEQIVINPANLSLSRGEAPQATGRAARRLPQLT